MQYCLIYITTFRWQAEISQENEAAMFVKTRFELVNEVIGRVEEPHSYEVPCIVALPMAKGNPDFLGWVNQSAK